MSENHRTTVTTTGAIKIMDGELKVYNGNTDLVVSISLTDPVRLQLIAELTDELRYPR